MCGYVNAYGGTIYIGVDDDGNVVGIAHIGKGNCRTCGRKSGFGV
ncbi:MAG: ATP-binding protein [Lachnospiraceae bacterium]|nr:ATP-binding protein [Lachnospiraceae bacterium]